MSRDSIVAADTFLSDTEREIWRAYNDTTITYPRRTGIVAAVAEVAERAPDDPAVVAEDGEMTYGVLHENADVVARLLRAHGVGPGDVVAFAATRRCSAYVALLGILRAACAAAPVDPAQPGERLGSILAGAGVQAVVADPASAVRMSAIPPGLKLRLLTEDSGSVSRWDAWPGAADGWDQAHEPSSPDHPLYVIHTSGSTGAPKGVRVSDGNLTNLANWYHARHAVTPESRLTQNAPLTFDPSFQQIFSGWSAGATVVVVPDAVRLDADAFLGWLAAQRITHLDIVTAHWTHLMAAAALRAPVELPSLEWIVVAGETLYFEQTREWFESVRSPCRIDNIYGPTEATINATEYEVPRERTRGKIPIGIPLPNYRIYIVDDAMEIAPPEVPGEICIAGAGVALGYTDPAATQRAFVTLQLGDGTVERIYRSGDRGILRREDEAWTLEFRGREDRQVKLAGHRVELEEVEAAAVACPGVEDAVAIVRGVPATQLLCFYAGPETEAESIKRCLAERLPRYSVPHAVYRVDRIPVTGNGKVDAEALVEIAASARSLPEDDRPVTDTERAIAQVWAEVLGVERVARNDDFFSLGGSSLLAARAVTALRERGLAVDGADLLGHATLAAIAVTAEAGRDATRQSTEMVPAGADRAIVGPLTSLALATGTEATLGSSLLDLRIEGRSAEEIEEWTADLFRRHVTLRMTRTAEGGGLGIVSAATVGVAFVDLPADPAEREDAIGALRRRINEHCRTWDACAGMAVLAREPSAHRLMIGAPHALLDGTSLRQMALELAYELGFGVARPHVPNRRFEETIAAAPHLSPEEARALESYLEAFARAEDRAAAALARRSGGGVHAAPAGTLPEMLAHLPSQELTSVLAAVLAGAVHDVFGLEEVPISKDHHGRDEMHPDAFATVANLMDLQPILVGVSDDFARTLASAADAVARGGEPPRHWLRTISRDLQRLVHEWPLPTLPFLASVRLSFGSGVEHDVADGVRVVANPHEIVPGAAPLVELAVSDEGSHTGLEILGGNVVPDAIAELAAVLAERLEAAVGSGAVEGVPEWAGR